MIIIIMHFIYNYLFEVQPLVFAVYMLHFGCNVSTMPLHSVKHIFFFYGHCPYLNILLETHGQNTQIIMTDNFEQTSKTYFNYLSFIFVNFE